MAYQIVDLKNNVLETLETLEQVEVVFKKAENMEVDYQLFWDDEGLLERLNDTLKEYPDAKYAIVKITE